MVSPTSTILICGELMTTLIDGGRFGLSVGGDGVGYPIRKFKH